MAIFFKDWAIDDLKALRRKLEDMYAQGLRQGTFRDQTLIFVSTIDLRQRMIDVEKAINSKEGGSKGKKQVRVTTRGRGFR